MGGIALLVWLLLLINTVRSEPHPVVTVINRSGRVIVGGTSFVILRSDHLWHDAVVLFAPYLVALIFAALLFWYSNRRLNQEA